MAITVAEDVDVLLDRLGTPPADDAYLDDLRHADRDVSPVVKVAVRQNWVYLRWLDDEFDGAPIGDGKSPVAHGGYEPEYFAGTGLPPALAAAVLKQWLATGERPDVVSWIDVDDLLGE
ncbi:MAG TPA: Imm1 family immunity protein [Pseudonocardiaceae bacterium]|nr:Imm1 family immunity protein [Pseudonocardiaceae bacterium]